MDACGGNRNALKRVRGGKSKSPLFSPGLVVEMKSRRDAPDLNKSLHGKGDAPDTATPASKKARSRGEDARQ